MSDRELLEYAAKAAGIDWDAQMDNGTIVIAAEAPIFWNPLTGDGDALRLAVKLNMTLAVGIARSDAGEFTEFDMCDTDPLAATRRAIVRAAAEIGRNMT